MDDLTTVFVNETNGAIKRLEEGVRSLSQAVFGVNMDNGVMTDVKAHDRILQQWPVVQAQVITLQGETKLIGALLEAMSRNTDTISEHTKKFKDVVEPTLIRFDKKFLVYATIHSTLTAVAIVVGYILAHFHIIG